jgi:hypothetical protein
LLFFYETLDSKKKRKTKYPQKRKETGKTGKETWE